MIDRAKGKGEICKMKVLIINFNRLSLPVRLAEWVASRGCDPIFIDNNSDYPPLLTYYEHTRFQVVRFKINYGHTTLWQFPLLKHLNITERFIYTDPDLDLTGVPDDFVDVMNAGLDKYPDYSKCALSLEIDDLPDTEEGNFIRTGPEKPYWEKPLDDLYFDADTDTTFAMYRYPIGEYGHSALRINRPYTCRHIPWYYENFNDLPEDEKYYYRTANNSCSHKIRFMKDADRCTGDYSDILPNNGPDITNTGE